MPKIEIKTAQNVSIEYELASLRDRILAYLLDFIIIIGSIIILRLIYYLVMGGSYTEYFDYFIGIPIFFFYALAFELLNQGKSIGKLAMGIRVVKLNGEEPTLNDYLTRWAFRMVDIYFSVGIVASFLITSSQKSQRLGDILAGTTVLKYKPDYSFHLSDLLNRETLDSYEPKYPDVRKFREEDMLLVKTMIDRISLYRNDAHAEALNMLAETIAKQLQLREVPRNKVEFLRTLLKDYIILTR
jgi:uncharacterized RDD family membrane protein YckC